MAAEPDSAETQTLLERVQAGDAEAPDQLLARHRTFLHRVVELRLDPRLRPASIRRMSCRRSSSKRFAACPTTCGGGPCRSACGCARRPTSA